MKLGIVGLPNVGKSTLFNAITSAGAESANYPFCTIEPNVGVVDVPDSRIDFLADMSNSKKKVYASCSFYDIAGLVKGASQGEGLGNQFLGHIREVDAICHVVRCFEDENITHVHNKIDPLDDIDVINLELIFADIQSLEKILSRLNKQAKADKSALVELEILEKAKKVLEDNKMLRAFDFSDDELDVIKSYNFLTLKPTIYIANTVFDGKNDNYVKAVEDRAKSEKSQCISICAQAEQEIAELDPEDKQLFLEEMGIEESGLDRLVKAGYKLLNLISFITTGEMETKAWSIKKGTLAPQAAGKIHSDIERGFIRAEVCDFDTLKELGSLQKAKDLGKLRLEGKEYVIEDGDVVHFRFAV